MDADWHIHTASAADADRLALVGAATFLESFAGLVDGEGLVAHCLHNHSADAYRAFFAKGAQAWIAQVGTGGAPVGYALVSPPELELARPGDVELKRIYLLSRFQGAGMAQALISAVLAASQGHERLLLGVKNDNHRALAFYRKQGFEIIGTRHFDVGGTLYDDYVLARALAPAPTA